MDPFTFLLSRRGIQKVYRTEILEKVVRYGLLRRALKNHIYLALFASYRRARPYRKQTEIVKDFVAAVELFGKSPQDFSIVTETHIMKFNYMNCSLPES